VDHHDGFGIAAADRPGLERLGAEVEALGYDELWANDTARGSGLAALAACARGARSVDLCVGVIGLSERNAGSIASEVAALDLPRERLVLGVGSGRSRSLALVEEGVTELRRMLPDVRIAVAAVGPRMLDLAGRIADVVLLNWAGPFRVAESRERIEAGAAAAERESPRVAAYVRVAVGVDATPRLTDEVGRYTRSGSWYAKQLEEQGPGLIGVACEDPADLAAALAPYRVALDSAVIRALPASDDVDAWLDLARAAAPSLRFGQ
jgi:alkanesulfonate monooxygenase SsuD/methylene tetrahydromethanopterin reductase-like flavin-dependent oxidoreductase (luciferase family)